MVLLEGSYKKKLYYVVYSQMAIPAQQNSNWIYLSFYPNFNLEGPKSERERET